MNQLDKWYKLNTRQTRKKNNKKQKKFTRDKHNLPYVWSLAKIGLLTYTLCDALRCSGDRYFPWRRVNAFYAEDFPVVTPSLIHFFSLQLVKVTRFYRAIVEDALKHLSEIHQCGSVFHCDNLCKCRPIRTYRERGEGGTTTVSCGSRGHALLLLHKCLRAFYVNASLQRMFPHPTAPGENPVKHTRTDAFKPLNWLCKIMQAYEW